MTIQFMPDKNMIRVGDKFFPAQFHSEIYNNTGFGVCGSLLVGETGKSLSLAIGCGTYNENYYRRYGFIDPTMEMNTVEVGFDFDAPRSEFSNDTFDVIGYIDDERLLEMISLVIEGKEPF
ncbi:MAG: hypothetical protein KDK65_04535 [Chlamydiia bacterium]|nr:hypothetical protein [Chlamydiia bacterium]